MIDPRGPRFAAWITSAVLAVVLLTHSATLLALQAVVFALGAAGRSPYAAIWRRIPKRPPSELEDAKPPQFAQLVGLGFAVIGVVGFLTWTPLGVILPLPRWWRPSSMPRSASASAARSTCWQRDQPLPEN